jgi:hypothetical protein
MEQSVEQQDRSSGARKSKSRSGSLAAALYVALFCIAFFCEFMLLEMRYHLIREHGSDLLRNNDGMIPVFFLEFFLFFVGVAVIWNKVKFWRVLFWLGCAPLAFFSAFSVYSPLLFRSRLGSTEVTPMIQIHIVDGPDSRPHLLDEFAEEEEENETTTERGRHLGDSHDFEEESSADSSRFHAEETE